MSVLVIDNYDSFTYNLVHLIEKLTDEQVIVVLHDKIEDATIEKSSKIILSPGPGLPSEAGQLPGIIKKYAGKIPMLGVCLGHQAIAECFGAKLENLNTVFHGVSSPVEIVEEDALFEGITSPVMAGRYHSWVVRSPLPAGFVELARDENGYNMAYVNKGLKVYGVQFHPESILTPAGEKLLANWLSIAK